METIKEFIIKLWERNKKKLLESLKAAVRYAFFTWASVIVSDLLSQPDIPVYIFMALTAIDKWLYMNWKDGKKKTIIGRGIFPL